MLREGNRDVAGIRRGTLLLYPSAAVASKIGISRIAAKEAKDRKSGRRELLTGHYSRGKWRRKLKIIYSDGNASIISPEEKMTICDSPEVKHLNS